MILGIGLLRDKPWSRIFERIAAPRQGALLSILAVAVEKQLPLVPVLEAFAQDLRGKWRNRTWELAGALDAGMPLPDALESIPGIAPPSAILTARVGAESGTLGPALRLAAETFTARQLAARSRLKSFLVYLAVLLVITSLIVGFIDYWIVPKLLMIFQDFGTTLPPLTSALIKFSNFVLLYFYLGLFAVIMVMFLIFTFRTLDAVESFVWRLLRDSLTLGFFIRFTPRYRAPDLLRSLSIVVQAGRPIVTGLASLESHLTDRTYRRIINKIRFSVEEGDDPWHAMTQAGLLRPADAAVLASAEKVGNLAWGLRTTADNIQRRLDGRLQLLLEFLQPAVMLFVGSVIGLFVVGLFLPLIKLLEDAS